MAAVLERKAIYLKDKIVCTCGTTFPVLLETRLSDQLWENSIDSELSDEEKCVCPTCKMEYVLEVKVEKRVETLWTQLETLGQFIKEENGNEINIAVLNNTWIGDRIVVSQGSLFEDEVLFPDGVFHTGGKEFTVENGVVTDYWNLADHNQMTIEEFIQ